MRRANDLTSFGKLVKIRLLEMNMDARELAEIIGTSSVQLSRILHGTRSGKKHRAKIVAALHIVDERKEA